MQYDTAKEEHGMEKDVWRRGGRGRVRQMRGDICLTECEVTGKSLPKALEPLVQLIPLRLWIPRGKLFAPEIVSTVFENKPGAALPSASSTGPSCDLAIQVDCFDVSADDAFIWAYLPSVLIHFMISIRSWG